MLAVADVVVLTLQQTGSNATDDSFGVAIAFTLMGLCSLVYAFTRSTAVRRTFATSRRKVPADATLLRNVSRRRRGHALAFAGLWIGVGMLIATMPIVLPVETRLVLEITPALMFLVGLVHAIQLHRLVAQSALPGLTVLAHGEFLYAVQEGRLVGWVSAPASVVARASGLPVARLHHSPL